MNIRTSCETREAERDGGGVFVTYICMYVCEEGVTFINKTAPIHKAQATWPLQ